MEIRKLTPEENIVHDGICQTVFFSRNPQDIRKMLENPKEHAEETKDIRWGAFGKRTKTGLEAGLIVIPYTFRMNGKDVKMAGIGGVTTLPESRGQGLINKIMEKAFQDMLESGQTFSFLYPFSHEYYRKLGYELCYTLNEVSFPPERLSHYPFPAGMEDYEPGDSVAPYAEVYKAFTETRNLAVQRDEAAWQKMLTRDPYQKFKFAYLHRTENNQPDAYILYDREAGSHKHINHLVVEELCWATPEGLKSILGFLGKLSAEFKSIRWHPPCDIDIHSMVPEPYDITTKTICKGMLRLVDVQKALETLHSPAGSGKVSITVSDQFLTKNAGTYTIQWEEGNLSVKKAQLQPGADMETTESTLAQLVTGYLTPSQAICKNDTIIHSHLSQLTALFPKQSLHITERF